MPADRKPHDMDVDLDDTLVRRIHLFAHRIGLVLVCCGAAYGLPYIAAFVSRSNLGVMEVVYGIWFAIALAFVVYSIPRCIGAFVAVFFTPRIPD